MTEKFTITLEDREFMRVQSEYARAMESFEGPSDELVERRRRTAAASDASHPEDPVAPETQESTPR